MRRWFIAFVAFFVAVQMSWAGAALCCVQELAEQQAALSSGSEVVHKAASGEAHAVCEAGSCHCHHAGCATPLAESRVTVLPQHLAPEPVATMRLKSHIPSGLERPNWPRPDSARRFLPLFHR